MYHTRVVPALKYSRSLCFISFRVFFFDRISTARSGATEQMASGTVAPEGILDHRINATSGIRTRLRIVRIIPCSPETAPSGCSSK
jgi:hypothetical protein